MDYQVPHKFVVLINGELKTYQKFEDIPLVVDNVIEFRPEFFPPPHTPEQHDENEKWYEKFKELMKRETQ